MNSRMIAENIFSAIDVIVDKKLREAKYDSTIIAKIIKVQDNALGRYEVQYQDAQFTALSVGGGVYSEGDLVYVLVPTNDLSRDKYILGLGNSNRRITALGDIVTTAQLEEIIKRIEELEKQDIPSLDDYAKKSDLDNYATKNALDELEVGDKVTVIPQGTGTETIATITVNENSYEIKAPKTEVVEAGSIVTYQGTDAADGDAIGTLTIDEIPYEIKAPSLANYAKTDDIPKNISNLNNDVGFITSSALNGYAKTDDIKSYDLSISAKEGSNGVFLQLEGDSTTDQIEIIGKGSATVKWENNQMQIQTPDTQKPLIAGANIALNEQSDAVEISANIPIATRDTLGLVKIGKDMIITGEGAINVQEANGETLGLVKSNFQGGEEPQGIVADIANGYVYYKDTTYQKATSSTLGLVKTGYTQQDKNYPVELNDDGQMFVNVPWSNWNPNYTLAIAKDNSKALILKDGQEDEVGEAVIAPYATKAESLEISDAIGGISQPVYFNTDGKPVAINQLEVSGSIFCNTTNTTSSIGIKRDNNFLLLTYWSEASKGLYLQKAVGQSKSIINIDGQDDAYFYGTADMAKDASKFNGKTIDNFLTTAGGTITNTLVCDNPDGFSYIATKTNDTDVVGLRSAETEYGLYDGSGNRWIVYVNEKGNIWLNGTAANADKLGGESSSVYTKATDVSAALSNYLPLKGGTLTGDLLPSINWKYNLGNQDYAWNVIYANSLIGALDWKNLYNVPLATYTSSEESAVAGLVKSAAVEGSNEPTWVGYKKAYIDKGFIYYYDEDTTYDKVQPSTNTQGLMSGEDKIKLDKLPEQLTMSYSSGVLTITYTE